MEISSSVYAGIFLKLDVLKHILKHFIVIEYLLTDNKNLQEDEMDSKKKGIGLVVIATTFWGMMGITSRKLSLSGLSTFDVSFLRCLIAGLLFTLWILRKDKNLLKLDIKGIIICSLYGIVAFASSFISYNISVERIPISIATVLMFTNPIWVTVFGFILFKEKITKKKVFVIILCILGCLCIADIFTAKNIDLDIIGVMAGLANGVTFALQIIIPRFFDGKYEKDTMLVYGFISGALFLLFFTDLSNITRSIHNNTQPMSVVMNILSIAILSTFIANTFYVKATEYIDTSLTSILVSLDPVLGSFFAFIVFGETLNLIQILGAIIVILAAVILEIDIKVFINNIKLNLKKEESQ